MKVLHWLFIEHISDVLVPLLSIFFTSLLTKEKYMKNVPLDKLEMAYNRVYFPILMLIKRTEKVDQQFVKECKVYLYKYRKYIDESTLVALKYLEETINSGNEKNIKKNYITFKNEIYRKNSYLRRYLGYLDSGFWTIYNVESLENKGYLRIAFELLLAYILAVIASFVRNTKYAVYFNMSIICVLLVVVIEIIIIRIIIFRKNK